jgi:hypothetical protein
MVKSVVADVVWGFPVMIPVLVSSERPLGSGGDTEKLTGLPPATTGLFGAIVVNLVYVTGELP